MPIVKLYFHSQSTYSRRVRICAREKNIALEEVHVAMEKLEHKKREFLTINPFGRVPVLEHNGYILRESGAILVYLDALFPEVPLIPPDAKKKALCHQYMTNADVDFARHCDLIYFPRRFLPETRWPHEEMKKALKALKRNIEIFSNELGDKPYLLEEFSMADICFIPFLQFFALTELTLPANLEKWAQSLLGRDSAIATAPPEIHK